MKLRGATVIGTVSSEAKAVEARALGVDDVIVYGHHSRLQRQLCSRALVALTSSTTRSVWRRPSNHCARCGCEACASSMVTAPELHRPSPSTPTLATLGSLYVTRPILNHYLLTEEERCRRAAETFGWVADGDVRVRIARTYELEQAAEAHELLESRSARGKVLLEVNA